MYKSLALLIVSLNLFAKALTISPTSLPNGQVGVAYSQRVSVTGGCTPYRWSLKSGTLPPGLSFTVSPDTTYETLAGAPTTANTYTFAVKVVSCTGTAASRTYTVTIAPGSQTHTVNLSWTQSTGNGQGDTIIGNNVYRSQVSGGPYTEIFISAIPITTYPDSTVQNGQTYYYVVTAVDNLGAESNPSNETSAVIPQ